MHAPTVRSFIAGATALAAAALLTGTAGAQVAGVHDLTAARGFSFDQIERDVPAGTAPEPGTFAADFAALGAARKAYDDKTRATMDHAKAAGRAAGATVAIAGLIPGVGAVAGGAVSGAAGAAARRAIAADVAEMARAAGARDRLGAHARIDVLDGAVRRTEDDGTVYISRPGMPLVRLDTIARTYHRYTPDETDRAALAARIPGGGTVGVHVERTIASLGASTIEGHVAQGSRTTATFALSDATGGCPQGAIRVSESAYTIDRAEPDMMMLPLEASVIALPCLARMDASVPTTVARMVLYRVIATDVANAPARLVERGNFQPLAPSASALFEIPAGYTED